MGKQRKIWGVILVVAMLTGLLSGCGAGEAKETSTTDADAASVEKEVQEEEKTAEESVEAEKKQDFKMAMISSEIGTEMFNLNAYNAMMDDSKELGFQAISVECTDTAAWEENIMAVSREGYDLVVGVGWNAAEAMAKAADMFPDTTYAIIDTVCENDKVTSITFREEEGAYVQGVMLANAFPDDKLFGYVCSYQTQATYKYRYGFEQGIKSVIPDAELIYNYINSYSDTSQVYEYAMQQAAAGCHVVIGGVSSAANSGIYQACLELADKGTPIYTTGLSVDQTTPDNPYILGGLLKNTGTCMDAIIREYIDGTLKAGIVAGGLKEDMFGVVMVTTDGAIYRNEEILTDDVVQAAKDAAAKIISGEIKIEVPEEVTQ